MAAAPSRSEAFPKEARIRKRSEFLETYRSGKKIFGRFVVVFIRPNGGHEPRLGVTATRKLGKAHMRNHRKRWTREIFRRVRRETGLESLGVDLVINLKANARDAAFDAFREDLVRTLTRASRDARRAMESDG